ncbi:MAG TPA: biotin--[acetyl-CoA-carboxylase] ligase [Aquabacterium sp.]|uniref:biotin--[acetyl-CoA-carboxylase] ligase n=1 Tax=Aquabacterium sp. TaxID=1872578 RepID=UPI002E318DE5|nr:biotin--[acetyl-CoA-carboxylase] ligase [Aquabacterium sp.]HEX5357523.1 biotin--[acetyl-CoA-carboxylase] ligase [Aquabacterium sp.]
MADTPLGAVQADLHAAAERIWEAASPACPELSVEVLPEIGSTNTELMTRGRRGETSPTFLAACRQTAGRGRQGRTWLAAPGDTLTFSLGLPMRLDEIPGGGSALSLAVGLAMAQGLETGLRAQPDQANTPAIGLKWPNDLWLNGRKLGGILIEATPAPGLSDGQRWVVIGIGLNVKQGPAPAEATALSSALSGGHVPSAGEVWSWVAPPLLTMARAFEASGFAPLQMAYSQRDVLAGQTVGLWATPGQGPADGFAPSDTGMAQGVSETGALLVHTDKGLQAWTTGEVSVRLRP